MQVSHTIGSNAIYLLWYYGTPDRLSDEVDKAVVRYREKYDLTPTHAWFKTGVEIDAGAAHGLKVGYKDCILLGHFEISAEVKEE